MASVVIAPIADGQWHFETLWNTGIGVRITLVLTDIDEQSQTDVVEWVANSPTQLSTVLQTLAQTISALPFWRARRLGDQLSISTAGDCITSDIQIEIYED